jgi:hypothetical protein
MSSDLELIWAESVTDSDELQAEVTINPGGGNSSFLE